MTHSRKTVVYGCGNLAEVMFELLQKSKRHVTSFTVEAEHLKKDRLEDCPVLVWEELHHTCAPSEIDLLIPLGWHEVNAVREKIYRQALSLNYRLPGYLSPSAIISMGCPDNVNLIVHAQALVGPKTKLGQNVYISAGANISHHCVIEDHVFIAPGVVIGGSSHIEHNAVLGLGAILRSGVRIGEGAFVGMGAVVTHDVEPHTVVAGNPTQRLNMSPQNACLSHPLGQVQDKQLPHA